MAGSKSFIAEISPEPAVLEAVKLMNQNKISGFRLRINKDKNPDKILLEEGSYIPEGEKDILDKISAGFKDGSACWGVCKVNFVKKGTETSIPHYYLLSWTSDRANVNLKMSSTCSKGYVRSALGDLIQNEIQINSLEDLDINVLQSKAGTLSKEQMDSIDGRKVTGKHGHYEKVIDDNC